MISESYDITVFLTEMIGKDYHVILDIADRECATAEARSYNVQGAPKARKLGSTRYASRIKKFLYFMQYRTLPDHLSDIELRLYKLICQSLVKKKQFTPDILELFS